MLLGLRVVMSTLFLLLVLTSPLVDARPKEEIPRFEDFPARASFQGRPAPVSLSSRQARQFRTVLREGAKQGPNFSGHYTIVEWGCGANCLAFAVVNARTGYVYFPSFKLYDGLMEMPEKLKTAQPDHYRLDSRLVVGYGSAKYSGKGMHYYRWDGRRFRLIQSVF